MPTQSAFILGHLIIDYILAAYESLHTMHTGMKGKKGYMAIKLDMSKAYDRLKWRFFRGGDEMYGVRREVDFSHYDVCNFGVIFGGSEWLHVDL